MIGVSSCLIGENCTYSGQNNLVKGLQRLYEAGLVVPVCPEVLGGLTTPRDPAEIQTLQPLLIETICHQDVTQEYVIGAQIALEIFIKNKIKVAILKFRSPSCGCDGVYDGSFQHRLIAGQGVFARMCEEHNIKVFHENQIEEFLKYIRKDEEYGTYFKDSTSF